MRPLRWVGYLFFGYIVLVFLFETVFLGIFQPTLESSTIKNLVITTTDDFGKVSPRKLAFIRQGSDLYVSAHHWPRGWFEEAMRTPEVEVEIDGVTGSYVAVRVLGEEFASVEKIFPLPFAIRFLMGFPPERDIMRLDRQVLKD